MVRLAARSRDDGVLGVLSAVHLRLEGRVGVAAEGEGLALEAVSEIWLEE